MTYYIHKCDLLIFIFLQLFQNHIYNSIHSEFQILLKVSHRKAFIELVFDGNDSNPIRIKQTSEMKLENYAVGNRLMQFHGKLYSDNKRDLFHQRFIATHQRLQTIKRIWQHRFPLACVEELWSCVPRLLEGVNRIAIRTLRCDGSSDSINDRGTLRTNSRRSSHKQNKRSDCDQ